MFRANAEQTSLKSQLPKGPRWLYYTPIRFPPRIFCNICPFWSSYTVSSIIERQENALRKTTYLPKQTRWASAVYLGPNITLSPFFFTTSKALKNTSMAVFASRTGMPVFWPFRSPWPVDYVSSLVLNGPVKAGNCHRSSSSNNIGDARTRRFFKLECYL